MTTSLAKIRFIVERDTEDTLDNETVVNWCNMAQNDFMLRIFVPDTYNLAVNTTDYVYTVPSDIRQVRMIRRQSDLDLKINRPYYPVYTLYDGQFNVPVPFGNPDTLVIDYYRYLTFFTDIDDLIDIEDRYFPLYTSFVSMRYYRLPSTVKRIGLEEANLRYQEGSVIYESSKKQVTDAYNINIGIQKPRESGW